MKSGKVDVWNVFKHAWKTRRWTVIVALLSIAIAFPVFYRIKRIGGISKEWGILESLITILTLIIAFIIWISELYKETEKNLPKRFTVIFEYDGRPVMRCREAYLSGEGDIRAWGQQIGLQMTKKQMLDFNPDIRQTPAEIRIIDKQKVNHYTVTFRLRELTPYLRDLYRCASRYPLVDWPPNIFLASQASKVLIGSTFPLSLIRKKVSIQPRTIEEMISIIRSREVMSFWGHDNSAKAASEILGIDVMPTKDRPVLVLTPDGHPALGGNVFDECWILSPELPPGIRPGINEQIPCEQIREWKVLKIEWEP